jgi:hypothetical protein
MEALKRIIEELEQEAAQIQILGRALTPEEVARVEAIQRAVSYLNQALGILSPKPPSTLITYKIVADLDGKLKRSARTACNFWNRFVVPNSSIVIRLGTFTANNYTIARAYRPYKIDGVSYGRVEFNTKYLSYYSEYKVSGTIIHEIGHTLGFGLKKWMALLDSKDGFTQAAINALPDLKDMSVETGGGPGTEYSHWDEEEHDEELMTGYKDNTEHVLPVTISIMELLGHQVAEELKQKTDLGVLLGEVAQVVFSRQEEAKAINLDHFEETDLWENIPHNQPISND